MLSLFLFAVAVAAKSQFAAYVVNWAHYRPAPWTYTAEDVRPIASRLDTILYSFIYFCPPAGTSPMPYWAVAPYGNCNDATEYQLLSVDPTDAQNMPSLVAMGPKVIMSIGGWNFPSAYFSKMVSSEASRTKFIASVQQWMRQYGTAGIDIDWEFPCSPARSNAVEISCESFRDVADAGGNCPADTNNLLLLVQELRKTLGSSAYVSIASQAENSHADQMNIAKVTPFIDMWHVMTYDYTVSDIPDQSASSPNAPLFTPKTGIQMSVNESMMHYLDAGIPASKLMVGFPLYAHTWYAPGLTGAQWQKFDVKSQVQGMCCGPFKSTYGAQPGKGCLMCGTMMYSEILLAQPKTFWDEPSQTMIGYLEQASVDGYTQAGTWISYNEKQSGKAFGKYVQDNNFAGLFIYSTDMDTTSGGTYTYELMNSLADALGK